MALTQTLILIYLLNYYLLTYLLAYVLMNRKNARCL